MRPVLENFEKLATAILQAPAKKKKKQTRKSASQEKPQKSDYCRILGFTAEYSKSVRKFTAT